MLKIWGLILKTVALVKFLKTEIFQIMYPNFGLHRSHENSHTLSFRFPEYFLFLKTSLMSVRMSSITTLFNMV